TRKDCDDIPAGSILVDDPVLQYLCTQPGDEARSKLVCVAEESHALRSVFPMINKTGVVESLLDGGSQIVSMSEEVAQQLGICWDPSIVIHMQSANRQLDKTLGLAKNVPFRFGDIPIYLQVHIIQNPAYKVLLGRPFYAITESEIKNAKDGGQLITLTDPNTGR
ncbi:hypothetical protein AMATHDRAFT_143503, partial [Amanita thiersii Skay4041]